MDDVLEEEPGKVSWAADTVSLVELTADESAEQAARARTAAKSTSATMSAERWWGGTRIPCSPAMWPPSLGPDYGVEDRQSLRGHRLPTQVLLSPLAGFCPQFPP